MKDSLHNPPQRIALIVVAAGRGSRSGLATGPKQYHLLAGIPVIARTLTAFEAFFKPSDIVIVIHKDDRQLALAAIASLSGANDYQCVDGGETRQASVRCGLEALAASPTPPDQVLIHDAARPFVSVAFLDEIIRAIKQNPSDALLPVLPIAETIKTINEQGVVVETLDRQGRFTAQTPQIFPFADIMALHRKAAAQGRDDFTDDAALYEWASMPVKTISGSPENVKLTYFKDFQKAEAELMNPKSPTIPDIRVGNGYDVHRFGPGSKVHLCGVAIPHEKTLSGHSDADVGLHALTDALLATCSAGDIGDHFPPSDPQWRGAASHIFLTHAAKIVRDHGGVILNVDVSLVAEAPKIAPFRSQMCAKLAELLGLAPHRCSVKATTNERMGFVGRNEGIAAIATASVYYGDLNG